MALNPSNSSNLEQLPLKGLLTNWKSHRVFRFSPTSMTLCDLQSPFNQSQLPVIDCSLQLDPYH